MRPFRSALLASVLALLMGAAAPSSQGESRSIAIDPVSFTGQLSVMTYNIHGLPWPIAWDRPAQFSRMADTLRALRAKGLNPHIVVLQEAFTQDAQAIGKAAGYRYIVDGPSVDMTNAEHPTPADARYASMASWFHGEDLGKYVGSGLQILSDYPIVGVRKMVFPSYACAGYDCFANKGALLASIRIPGRSDPVDIVTTHLNSRHASGVEEARSIYAYRLQTKFLTEFIRKAHDPSRALIVAGDFNVGRAQPRRSDLLLHVRNTWAQDGDIDDAYGAAAAAGMTLPPDAIFSRKRARDWQFYAPGRLTDIELDRIEVPFGHATDGSMLSDHVGYTAVFDLGTRTASSTNARRSTA